MNIVVKILIFLSALYTQIEPPQGLVENAPSVWALQNARIHLSSSNILENGTILIRDGLIENVGARINIPDDATIIDMTGKISPF